MNLDQDRRSFGPDLDSNCLQMLSADDKSGPWQDERKSNEVLSHMRKISLTAHTGIYSGARGLLFDLNLPLLFFAYARSEDTGDTAHMRMLV